MNKQFDVVIRGGLVLDGTGEAAFEGDVAVENGKIAAVGHVAASGREEIDARGKIVTPGFIDIHTHYDAQVTWAERLSPSSSHGVTTVLMGNCGVGFAPCRPQDRGELVRLMEGVEDIPELVMSEGLSWEWETFPDFLDAIERRPHDIDFAAMLPHSPLRVYVMGDRAIKLDAATPDDMAKMAVLAAEAMRAGALGFSSSRSTAHRTKAGEAIPSHGALEDELRTIALGVSSVGDRVLEFATDFGYSDKNVATEIGMLKRVVQASGLPMSLSIALTNDRPSLSDELMHELSEAKAQGASIKLQVLGRAVGIHLGHELSLSPFSMTPTYQSLMGLPIKEKFTGLRDAQTRCNILKEFAIGNKSVTLINNFDNLFVLSDRLNYEPAPGQCVSELAKTKGVSAAEYAYDYLLEREGCSVLYAPLTSYSDGTLDSMLPLMRHDRTLLGLGDGGAHVGMITDAAVPTFVLTHWVRDRAKERLSLPWAVQALTSRNAAAIGVHDRGVLKPGYKGDVNVIDFEKLGLFYPEVLYDLPAGGRRMTQRARGYVATLVNGQVIVRNDEATGAMPGRLVRGPQAAPN